jgi:hypothetical protein
LHGINQFIKLQKENFIRPRKKPMNIYFALVVVASSGVSQPWMDLADPPKIRAQKCVA